MVVVGCILCTIVHICLMPGVEIHNSSNNVGCDATSIMRSISANVLSYLKFWEQRFGIRENARNSSHNSG